MSFTKYLHPLWRTLLTKDGDTHNAVLASLEDAFKTVESDAIDSRLEASLPTATGEWLDEFGDIFGVFRKDGEKDDDYRRRIVNYILIERGTTVSIEDTIQKFLDDPTAKIEIYEPYKNVFILNKSKLNGEDHILGRYYTSAVIDVRLMKHVPLELLDEIEKYKPAGVKAMVTRNPNRLRDEAVIANKRIINLRNLLVKTKNYSGNDDPWSYNPTTVTILPKIQSGTKVVQTTVNWGSIRYNVPSIVNRGAAKVGDTITYAQDVRVTNNFFVNGNFVNGIEPSSTTYPQGLTLGTDPTYGNIATMTSLNATADSWRGIRQPLSSSNITSLKKGEVIRISFKYRINATNVEQSGVGVEIKGKDSTGKDKNVWLGQQLPPSATVGVWTQYENTVSIADDVTEPYFFTWIRQNGSFSITDIEITKIDLIKPIPVKFFCDGSSKVGTVVGTATADWQRFSITIPLEQNIIANNGKLRYEVDVIAGTGNVFQTAAQTLVVGTTPLNYTAAPEDFGAKIEDYDIQEKIASLISKKDSTYLRLLDNGIIGYKRIDKMIPLIPVEGNEQKKYPKLKYKNKDFFMIPLAKMKSENVNLLYYQATVKGGALDNKGYLERHIEEQPTSKVGYKDILLPNDVTKAGSISHVEYLPSYTKNIVLNGSCNNVYPFVYSDDIRSDRPTDMTTLRFQRCDTDFKEDYIEMTCKDYNDSFLQLGQYWQELVNFSKDDKVSVSFDLYSDVPNANVVFFYHNGTLWQESPHIVTAKTGEWSRITFTEPMRSTAQHIMWRIRFPRVASSNGAKMRIKNICINKGDPIPYEEGKATQLRADNLNMVEEFVIKISNK
ncbi:galactose-binding-like protein [Bacillus phage vB_BthM-Goe5]|nr:galactose-binding-like protein [Bacillus phage vB_BthM-Goe5]